MVSKYLRFKEKITETYLARDPLAIRKKVSGYLSQRFLECTKMYFQDFQKTLFGNNFPKI